MKIKSYDFKRKPIALLIASLILLFFLPAAYYLTTHPFAAQAAWFNDQWGYRKEIPVTAHTSAETYVYLNLTGAAAIDTSDTTKFQTDCGDLRFTDVHGEKLKYYLVSGCSTATTVVHVLIPDFPTGAQTFYYYYGNPTVGNGTESADFSTAASGVTIGSVGAEEESPAPTAYWKMDEGYGTNAFDASGHGYSGSISGAAWLTEDLCISGKCLFFDGTNDAVTISNTVAGVQTISFWIKPATTTEQFIALSGSAYITASGGALSATGFTSPTIYVDGKVSTTITANRWQHVAVTTGTALSASAITIGQVSTDYGQTFIDDVKLYQYARSASEIKTDFNADKAHAASAKGSSVSYSSRDNNDALSNGLVGYWKTDSSSGDALDSSGNSYSLTNNAVATYVAGKFGNAANLVAASSQFFSTATDLGGINTIAFWVYPTSSTTYLIDLDGTRTITASSGTISANSFTSPTIYVNGAVSSTLSVNVWQHVAVTTTSSITANAFKVGKVGSNFFDGKIDEARLYSRALQPSEVAFLYNFAPGPIGSWKLDENTGQSANDSSGNSYTGTLGADSSIGSDDPTWTTGKYGNGLSSDGGDYVNIGNVSNLEAGTNFTVSVWFTNSDTSTTTERYIASKYNSSNNAWLLGKKVSADGDFGFQVRTAAGVNATASVSTQQYNDGKWHYATGIKSDTSVFLYIDGVLVANGSRASLASTSGTASVRISGIDNSGTPANMWLGKLDDVRIFNYARTAKQVIEDMNAGHPAPGSPVGSYVARYKFDDLSGTTAQDASSNDNDLTLSSASWTTNGKFGGAWNGTNAVWLSRTDDPDFDFTATEDFSISVWFKSDSDANPAATEYLVNKASATSAGYAIYTNTSGQICFAIDDDATWDPDVASCSSSDFYDGLWHQAIGVRDVTADTTSIYIDGILRDSDSDTTTASLANALSLFVGDRDGADNSDEFVGDLDELKVFRSALTTEQVKLDLNQDSSQVLGSLSTASDGTTTSNSTERSYCVPGDTTTCNAPIGEWKFDENTGSAAANDSSGNGKTGTITGATFTAGKIGSALNFNGGTNTVSSISSISGIKTVAFWVFPASTTANMIDINTTGPAYISASGGTISATGFTSPTIYVNGQVSSTLTANIWQFIAVTTDTALTGSAVQLGRANGTSLSGKLDQVRFYDTARTPAQIAWDFNHGAPLAHYKFDECQGTTAYNAAPNANGTAAGMNGTIAAGSSGNTAVGTCTTSATTMWYNGRTGKYNSALDFDGTDDSVTVASTTTLQITGDITVSAWVNIASFANNDYIYAHSTDSETQATNNLYSLRFNTGSGNDLLYEHERGAGVNTVNTFDTNLSVGTWYNIVTVRDTTANTIKIFVNGIQRDSTYTYTNDPDGGTSGYLTIGARNALDISTGFMDGLIDDVKIFNYALTATQTKTLYNEGTVRYGPTTGSP